MAPGADVYARSKPRENAIVGDLETLLLADASVLVKDGLPFLIDFDHVNHKKLRHRVPYPFVARSCWFTDVTGNTLTEVAATLPAGRVAILQERSRARALNATVGELLTELRA